MLHWQLEPLCAPQKGFGVEALLEGFSGSMASGCVCSCRGELLTRPASSSGC